MIELISKFKKNRKYNGTGLSYVINKGTKIKPCEICGATVLSENCPKVVFSCECNYERKCYLYTGERSCGVVVACPECKKELVLCC